MNPRLYFSRLAVVGILCWAGAQQAVSQPAYVGAKREFRGVWIATVKNYDWPLSRSMSTKQQQDSLLVLLDTFAAAGFNAVIFQVRPECDALYESPFEPWSYWLTGTQGVAPNPRYDPLQFALAEAHKRGMEIHAWFNPYRAYREDNSYPRHATHVTQQHPEWVITCPDKYIFMDPGLPQVRDYVAKIVADVVRRYDVDGVHFDDYFYPYPEHSFTRQDSLTWAAYPRGFKWDSLAFWRRDNVNFLMRQVNDSIKATKPWVKFGASPFGIWKSSVPPGITGLSAYNDIYCDAVAWLQGQYIDYVVPQLYWKFGGGQDYGVLQPWWASQRNGRHFYTGHADYQIQQSGWAATEITRQIRFNQTNGNAQGSVQFRAYNIRSNDGGILDQLKGDVFRYPSLVPLMEWREATPPNAPQNLQLIPLSSQQAIALQWQPPTAAADGDTAARYVVYRFRTSSYSPADLENPRNVITLAGTSTIIPPARIDSVNVQYYYAVSALDKNNNESTLSNLVTAFAPLAAPVLYLPADGEQNYAKQAPLQWRRTAGATLYRVQLDTSGTFLAENLLLNRLTSDTFAVPGNLQAQKTYFWHTIAGSQAAEGPASATRSFRTGWPLPPTLIYPISVTNVPRMPPFRWRKGSGVSFHVRVVDFVTRITVIDTTVTDTTFVSSTVLTASRTHTWNATAINPYGESDWSIEGRFQTGTAMAMVEGEKALPERFDLAQNFPNPFNPTTTIRFSLPERSRVTMRVYSVLGQEVTTLLDETMESGYRSVEFNAAGLPSGVYLYRLQAAGFVGTRKMVLIR